MATENEKKKKKYNRPAGIPKRNKQSYAQYVWIREIFNRQDMLDARIKELEETVKFIKDCLVELDEELKKAAKKND